MLPTHFIDLFIAKRTILAMIIINDYIQYYVLRCIMCAITKNETQNILLNMPIRTLAIVRVSKGASLSCARLSFVMFLSSKYLSLFLRSFFVYHILRLNFDSLFNLGFLNEFYFSILYKPNKEKRH